jgi:hypothetical protein
MLTERGCIDVYWVQLAPNSSVCPVVRFCERDNEPVGTIEMGNYVVRERVRMC